MARSVLLLLSALLIGCQNASSSPDAVAKGKLVGSWRLEYVDDFDRPYQATFTLSDKGTFFGVELTRYPEFMGEIRSSGPWYVTDGLFKLHTAQKNGKELALNQMTYFTCRIVGMDADHFSCRDDVENKTYSFKRTQLRRSAT